MKKVILWGLVAILFLTGCNNDTKTAYSDEPVTSTSELENVVSVSTTTDISYEPEPVSEVTTKDMEPEPEPEPEPLFTDEEYELLVKDISKWEVEKLDPQMLYANEVVNVREEPYRKGKIADSVSYNGTVVVVGRVHNYKDCGLDFYLLTDGRYVCTDYFSKELNVPELGEGGLVYYSEQIYSYERMCEDIKELSDEYPDYVTAEVIGTTPDGRDIYGIRLGVPADKAFLIFATIHADEYMNTPLCMEQIDTYLQNWDVVYKDGKTYGEILNSCNLYYIPCLNPDGMTLVQYGAEALLTEDCREFIKSVGYSEPWTANANGVDLNRNWDCSWNPSNVEHSTRPASMYYPGKKAFSEPETIAVRDWVNDNAKGLKGALSYHQKGNVIYWYSNQKEKTNEYKQTKKWAEALEKLTGYEKGGDDKNDLRGLEYNWFNLVAHIPCIEIETGKGDALPLPYSVWRTIWRANKNVGIELAHLNK